jgi:hypothetical protein
VIDLDADGRGIDGASLAGIFAVALKFGMRARAEKAEGIEVGFEVSPLAVGGEDVLPIKVGAIG